MTRVLALVAALDDPSARYRVSGLAPALARRGVDLEIAAIPSRRRERRALFRDAARHDGVLWQRRLLPPWDAAALRASARRLAFDFDDALPLRDSASGAAPSLARRWKFGAAIRRADVVIAANATLAGLARAAGGAPRIEIVPTVVDPARAVVRESASREGAASEGPLVAGWIGGRATRPYLDALREPLSEAARALGGALRLRVVADAPPERASALVEFRPWSEATESAEVARFDVGLAPLPDDAWARGKSGLKVLQYGAAAVPAVASDVGVQGEIVRDGATGFLARSSEEWVDRIVRLARDPSLRASLGAAARERVVRHYSVEAVADRLAAILDFTAVADAAPPDAGR